MDPITAVYCLGRRSRGRKWLVKCYLFGEAEAARCWALTGMDEAEQTTPLSVPEPSSTGATALQKRTAGAHTGRFQGLLTIVQLVELLYRTMSEILGAESASSSGHGLTRRYVSEKIH